MSRFRIYFDTNSAAFEGDETRTEVTRILDRIKERVNEGATGGLVFDINGNRIGVWGWAG